MIKAFLKYLLPACLVLLAFFGQPTAYAPADSAYVPAANQLNRSVQASLAQAQHHHSFLIKTAEPGTRKGNEILAAVEKEAEEVESVASKKYLESSIFFTAVLPGLILAYFFSALESYLAFCKSVSYFSSHRWYLLFRVFRI